MSEQQNVEGEASISLLQFDNQYDLVYLDKEINSADSLTEETFRPRGMTALYYAVGRTMNSGGQRLAGMVESDGLFTLLIVPNQTLNFDLLWK